MMKKSELIRQAIAYIRKHGFYQGSLWPKGQTRHDDGPACARGAMMRVMRVYSSNYLELVAARELNRDTPHSSIVLFNDNNDRTTVLRQMGKTARRLEKEGR